MVGKYSLLKQYFKYVFAIMLSTSVLFVSPVSAEVVSLSAPGSVTSLKFLTPCASSITAAIQGMECSAYVISWPRASTEGNPSDTEYIVSAPDPSQWFKSWSMTCGNPESFSVFSTQMNRTFSGSAFSLIPAIYIKSDRVVCEAVVVSVLGVPIGQITVRAQQGVNRSEESTATPTGSIPSIQTSSVSPQMRQISVSWTASAGSGNGAGTGYFVASATDLAGNITSCRTASNSCVIAGLDMSTAYAVSVSSEYSFGLGESYLVANGVIPVPTARVLTLSVPVVVVGGYFTATAYGGTPSTTVSIGVPGSVQTCVFNTYGACQVSLRVKTKGSFQVLAIQGKKSATVRSWYPSFKSPTTVRHGATISLNIQYLPPKTSVTIVTNDNRTLRATSTASGSVSIKISTKSPQFLSLTPTIAGTVFPALNVQVF